MTQKERMLSGLLYIFEGDELTQAIEHRRRSFKTV